MCHATGALAADPGWEPAALPQWPPTDATPVDLTQAYTELADAGYRYGPAFQNLHALWRHGADSYAEVRLDPERQREIGGFVLHPALLDACLHPLGLSAAEATADGVAVPFAFGAVWVRAGSEPARVRVQVRSTGARSGGHAVRPGRGSGGHHHGTDHPPAARRRPDHHTAHLYPLRWVPVAAPAAGSLGSVVVLGRSLPELPGVPVVDGLAGLAGSGATVVLFPVLTDPGADLDVDAGADPGAGPEVGAGAGAGVGVVAGTHAVLVGVAGLIRRWLAGDGLAGCRLVVVTRGAVPEGRDLVGAAVWGLVRAAQAEHPDMFTLLDLDPATDSTRDRPRPGGGS